MYHDETMNFIRFFHFCLYIYKEIRRPVLPADFLLEVPDHLATIPAAQPCAQDALGHPQAVPRRPQTRRDAPKTLPRAPRTPPIRPQDAPRRFQDDSKTRKIEPKRFEIHSKIDPKTDLTIKALQSKKVLFS